MYKVTKVYEDENFLPIVDLDDGDNFRIIGKPISMISPIPKRTRGK